MTVRFERAKAEHFQQIELLHPDREFEEIFRTEAAALAQVCHPRWSAAAVCDWGPIAIGGVLPDGQAWFLMASIATLREMVIVRKYTSRVIATFQKDNPRVEVRATVDGNYPKRVIWAKRLGFLHTGEGNSWVFKPS